MASRSEATRTVLQASSRAIQFRPIAGKYLVQYGAVFVESLFVHPPGLDFLIPPHSLQVIQDGEQWLNGPKKVSDFKRFQR
ncbi:hypothetical protein COMA2_20206 [Candidatus Nitrospira nitrificans]|uniref:Uncharacterized protein n=1 Tax=Candidatus Nitrospira nitrificans TaxID=1742973 RepID=A0A0S4LH36_9BACT|nr:hypothetical protein COMA2_20206 [Candidatus Nitrospira nitrificans]